MLQYRPAEPNDFLALTSLIKEYCTECGFSQDETAIQHYISWGLKNTNTIVAVEDDKPIGIINFIVSPHHFTGIPCGRKMAWFVSKDYRGKAGLVLLKKAEEKAKELGAKYFYCSTPTKMLTDYMPLETEYIKELN